LQIETYDHLNRALDGEVLVDIGQVGPLSRKALDRAVRAGQLVKWRGKWFPLAGAAFGIGPDKNCWSTPEVAAHFATMRGGVEVYLPTRNETVAA
jgi:hypothetical protein